MRSVARCALLAGALVSWMSLQDAPGPNPPTVESVIALAEAAYSSIDAFAATGWVESECFADDGSRRPDVFGRRQLDVFMARPDTLMFMVVHPGSEEYRTPWSWMMSAQGGQATYTSSASPVKIESTSLEGGLGASASLASHSTSLIAGLVLPSAVTRFRLRDLVEPALVGEESLRDVACWKVAGKVARMPHTVTLWIAKSTGYVSRATLEHPLSEVTCLATIEFETMHARAHGERAMQPVLGRPAR